MKIVVYIDMCDYFYCSFIISLVVDKVSTRNEFKERQNYTKPLRKLLLAFEVSKIS